MILLFLLAALSRLIISGNIIDIPKTLLIIKTRSWKLAKSLASAIAKLPFSISTVTLRYGELSILIYLGVFIKVST